MTMITNLDLFGRSSSVGHPVIEERCVSFHKCHREALEEVLDGGLLFFAICRDRIDQILLPPVWKTCFSTLG